MRAILEFRVVPHSKQWGWKNSNSPYSWDDMEKQHVTEHLLSNGLVLASGGSCGTGVCQDTRCMTDKEHSAILAGIITDSHHWYRHLC